MINELLSETRYLAIGFSNNLLIAVIALGAGSMIGALLAWCRKNRFRLIRLLAEGLTSLCRNVPSLVLLFYIAFMIPKEIMIFDAHIPVPLWFKASLALTIPVIGFASDQVLAALRQQNAATHALASTLITAWAQYALIVLMASSTATILGADEIVGRANVLIAKRDDPAFLLATYGYVSMWFLASGLVISGVSKFLAKRVLN